MSVLLAIDIGTTGVRVAALSSRGAIVGEASVACPHDAPAPGWAEANPETWWRAVVRACTELGHSTDLTKVAAVAVTGQAPTAVLVDDAGGVVRPAILWLDTRAETEARALGTHAYYLGPKLAWLAKHEPRIVAQTRWVLQSHAFIAFRLTGAVAVDPSTAALCHPLFDLASLDWSSAAVETLGTVGGGARWSVEQMPPVVESQKVLGEIKADAARETGLAPGTPVVSGGGDFAAATLGAGVLTQGEACLMLGTAGNLLVPRSTPGTDPRLINAHHVGTRSWLTLGGTLSGGAQEWLRHALVRGTTSDDDTAVRGALPSFELLDSEASRVDVGSEGLLFLPYLQGERTPIWDVHARGAYVGLGLSHGRGHLWRALLEGVALGFADCQRVVEDDGITLAEVVAANGGGKSALFRQILCDALGVPLTYTPRAGGTIAGAAILAALGVGLLEDASEARAWRGETIRHEPNAVAHAIYRERLAIRRQVYEGLKGAFGELARSRTEERVES